MRRFIWPCSFIDFNLANQDTNYYEKQGVGKNCYRAHVDIENFMHALSVEKSVEVFRGNGSDGDWQEIDWYISGEEGIEMRDEVGSFFEEDRNSGRKAGGWKN